jgi:WASH complex subunit 7
LFGEFLNQKEPEEGEIQLQVGRMLPFLQEVSKFIERAYAIIKNATYQLASLYHPKQKLYQTSFKDVHLQTVVDHLGELFGVLIAMDEIIMSNQQYSNAFNTYKR